MEMEGTTSGNEGFEVHVSYLTICFWHNLLNEGRPISFYDTVTRTAAGVTKATSTTTNMITTTTIRVMCKEVQKCGKFVFAKQCIEFHNIIQL